MSALLDQFINEARDLLEEINAGLLALEEDPANPQTLESLFRAVHTLKGSSGLFEAAPLTEVLHAAEDLLSRIRQGELAGGREVLDDLFAAMDRVESWVGTMEAEGDLPGDAPQVADELGGRIRARMDGPAPEASGGGAEGGAAAEVVGDWPEAFLQAAYAATAGAEAAVALVYTPDAQCFFSGEDPLQLMRSLPQLAALDFAPAEPWADPAAFDPFDCRLRFRAVSTADPEAVREALAYVADQLQLAPVGPAELILPQGEALGNGEFRQFAAKARELLGEGHLQALREAVAELRQATGAEVWEASVLRWLDTVLAQAEPDATAAWALVESLETGKNPVCDDVAAAEELPAGPDAPAAGGGGRSPTLRVDQQKVDQLMDLVGELIVAANGLPYLAEKAESPDTSQEELVRALKEQHSLFDRLAREMQGEVMQVRMLPVSAAFQRFPRLVRDLSRQLGKEARLETSGESTEADKQILDQLGEPLVHVVRNSLDHGLETPEEREAAGKDRCGWIRMSAFPESERIIIQVEDDGRGIDPERVKAKAVERGLISAEEAETLEESQAVALVMQPGFSTAEQISDVSGRGVGMDAVRSMVEDSGGTLSIANRPQGGTCVRMDLPMSMAVTRVLLVEAGAQKFGVPFPNVLETLRVDPTTIHGVKDQRAMSWRGRFIPLVDLAQQLGKTRQPPAEGEWPPVLVARVGAQEVAFLVDDFHSGTDVVVKPLAGCLEGTPGVTGTGVLGDGSVLLVLAMEELV